jgi:hypothetical protein
MTNLQLAIIPRLNIISRLIANIIRSFRQQIHP